MVVLSDADLKRLYPFAQNIGPASIDLCIGHELSVWPSWVVRDPRIDQSDRWRKVETVENNGPTWTLHPGHRYLSATMQRVQIPSGYAAQVSARSSWGRDGLSVIIGPAGWVDPGWDGVLTLELTVTGSPLVLWPGAMVCQLVLLALSSPPKRAYSGRYQGDQDAAPSRLYQDWEASDGV